MGQVCVVLTPDPHVADVREDLAVTDAEALHQASTMPESISRR
jgi:hypothetical protein